MKQWNTNVLLSYQTFLDKLDKKRMLKSMEMLRIKLVNCFPRYLMMMTSE